MEKVLSGVLSLFFLASCSFIIGTKYPDLSNEKHKNFLNLIIDKKRKSPIELVDLKIIKNNLLEANVYGQKVPYREVKYELKLKITSDCYVIDRANAFKTDIDTTCIESQILKKDDWRRAKPELLIKKDENIQVNELFIRYECSRDCSSENDWFTPSLW
jgi:hypothetical protein